MKKWKCPACGKLVYVEVDYKGRVVLFDGEDYHKCRLHEFVKENKND